MDDYTKKIEDREREREEKELERKLQLNRERMWMFRFVAYLAAIIALFMAVILGFGPIYAVWAQRLSGELKISDGKLLKPKQIIDGSFFKLKAKWLAA